jgi:hypothetical protein
LVSPLLAEPHMMSKLYDGKSADWMEKVSDDQYQA